MGWGRPPLFSEPPFPSEKWGAIACLPWELGYPGLSTDGSEPNKGRDSEVLGCSQPRAAEGSARRGPAQQPGGLPRALSSVVGREAARLLPAACSAPPWGLRPVCCPRRRREPAGRPVGLTGVVTGRLLRMPGGRAVPPHTCPHSCPLFLALEFPAKEK